MRYFYAVVCPPLAFLACGRWIQTAIATLLFVLAIMTAHLGLGVAIELGLILWAIHSVGDEHARLESRVFVASVTADSQARRSRY